MKNYKIHSFIRVINGVQHRYNRHEPNGNFGGDYRCTTFNNDSMTETDFCCESDSFINSIESTNSLQGIFTIGEATPTGIIRQFRLRNKAGQVLISSDLTRWLQIENLIKMPKITKEAPSRSQIKKEDTELQKLEDKILTTKSLRLKEFYKRDLPETLQEFLHKFFIGYNNEFQTIFVETKELQTDTAKRRSLGDIFLICKYYYPKCTLQEVLNLLYKVMPTLIKRGWRRSHCFMINKRVFYYDYQQGNNISDSGRADEFKHDEKWYLDKL